MTGTKLNWRIGSFGRLLAPGYSTCWDCGTPWRFVEPRLVAYKPSSAQFALCVKCWDEATVSRRIAAHLSVTMRWETRYPAEHEGVWADIYEAVVDGRTWQDYHPQVPA